MQVLQRFVEFSIFRFFQVVLFKHLKLKKVALFENYFSLFIFAEC